MEFNKIFFTILIFILTAVGVFFFVMPKYREFSMLGDTVLQKQAEYEGKFIYYTRVQELLVGIEGKGEPLGKVADALPGEFSYATLMYSLQKDASDSGLSIKSIAFAPPVVDPLISRAAPVKEASFSLKLSGSYESLKAFMASLETSARLFRVDSLSFSAAVDPITSAAAASAQGEKYDFDMVVKTNSY